MDNENFLGLGLHQAVNQPHCLPKEVQVRHRLEDHKAAIAVMQVESSGADIEGCQQEVLPKIDQSGKTYQRSRCFFRISLWTISRSYCATTQPSRGCTFFSVGGFSNRRIFPRRYRFVDSNRLRTGHIKRQLGGKIERSPGCLVFECWMSSRAEFPHQDKATCQYGSGQVEFFVLPVHEYSQSSF